MHARNIALWFALALCGTGLARAADLVGRWSSEFDSQIGPQKYAYEFTLDEGKLTGKATFDHSMGKGTNVLKDIKVNGDDVSFTEPLSIQGMDIIVTYKGKLAGDEMKLTRQAGDFATEQIVVKRLKAGEAPAAPESPHGLGVAPAP